MKSRLPNLLFRFSTTSILLVRMAGAQCPAARGDSAGNYLLPGVLSNIEYTKGQRLDAFAPAGAARPAALLIHGSSGDKSTHLTQLFPLLSEAGYAWFSVNYRDIRDLRKAVAFVECPGRFPIQKRLWLIGEDTGVAMALKLAGEGGFAGVAGFGSTQSIAALRGPESKGKRNGVVLLFHGTADDESPIEPIREVCASWRDCRLFPVTGAIHNFENWHPDQWTWREELTAQLRQGRRGIWKNIAYARPGGRPLLLDASIPTGEGRFAAVIIVHGGGWEAGDKETYISPVLEPLAQAGFAWFSIDYRLTPYVRNADQLEDLRDAIRYVRSHSETFHVDPDRIALLGESAGGQMVAQVGSLPCDGCKVQAVVSFYGVYDFRRWAHEAEGKPMLDRLFGRWDEAKLAEFSPLEHVSKAGPPMLLLQGTADELYPGTMAYDKRLSEMGVPHELVLLQGAPHGMENWAGHPEWSFYRGRMTGWLDRTLRGSVTISEPRASGSARHTH